MSDPYDLAPVPPPPPPMPVEVMPVEPIGYSGPSSGGRPGIMTAVGVISIVVAGLGIFGGGLISLWMILIASIASAASHVKVPAPAPIVTSTNVVDSVNPTGMSEVQRGIVLDGMMRVRPLTDQRRRLLEELLAEDGKAIMLLPEDSLTADRVAANVSDSGRLLTSRGGDDGPEYFIVGTGKVEVGDDHASFYATDGSAPVRVTADSLPETGGAAVASGLSDRQMRSIFRRIKFLGGNMNAAQTKVLTQTLANPNEQLIVPMAGGVDPATEIMSFTTAPDGSVTMVTQHGVMTSIITLDPAGLVTNSMTTNNGAFGGGGNPFGTINPLAMTLAVLAAIGSFIMAVYLLICGIMVLRQSPRGRALHWIYVALKIPLEIFSGVAIWYLFSQMMPSATNLAGGRALNTGFTGMMLVPVVLGCIYPIALLFVLSSRTVQEYYAAEE